MEKIYFYCLTNIWYPDIIQLLIPNSTNSTNFGHIMANLCCDVPHDVVSYGRAIC